MRHLKCRFIHSPYAQLNPEGIGLPNGGDNDPTMSRVGHARSSIREIAATIVSSAIRSLIGYLSRCCAIDESIRSPSRAPRNGKSRGTRVESHVELQVFGNYRGERFAPDNPRSSLLLSLSLSLSLSLHAIKSSSGSFDHFLDTLKRIRARALTG